MARFSPPKLKTLPPHTSEKKQVPGSGFCWQEAEQGMVLQGCLAGVSHEIPFCSAPCWKYRHSGVSMGKPMKPGDEGTKDRSKHIPEQG